MVVDEKKEKKGEDSFFSSAHTASDLEPWLVLRAYVTAPDTIWPSSLPRPPSHKCGGIYHTVFTVIRQSKMLGYHILAVCQEERKEAVYQEERSNEVKKKIK
jgi:hypothetical protein